VCIRFPSYDRRQSYVLLHTNILNTDAIRLVVLLHAVLFLLWVLVPPLFLQLLKFPLVQKLQNSVKEFSLS